MSTKIRPSGPAIPLARWADRHLKAMGAAHSCAALNALDGPTLMGERGSHGQYRINGTTSAGLGGSRLMPTYDGGWFALTLIRDIDRELLPALFGDDKIDVHNWDAIAQATALQYAAQLVETGRILGLPVAMADEVPISPPIQIITQGPHRQRSPDHRPVVVDLSAIWAGPLVGHLLWQAGMKVIKIESRSRPDLIRRDDPATFDRINQGKSSVLVDFSSQEEKSSLISLIRQADIVIESSRPRALRHLGIDADRLVQEVPGLVWLSVTGHGATGDAANWVGIGNDCGVAGGLSRAMAQVSGNMGYVGDAIADPLTGITGASEGLRAYVSGFAQRIGLSMSAIAAMALEQERTYDRATLDHELYVWGTAVGKLFPQVPLRELIAPIRPIGADTAAIFAHHALC